MRQKRENSFSDLMDTIKEYINLKVEYGLLTVTERASLLIGKMAFVLLMGVLALVVLLMVLVLIYNLLMSWIGIPWLVALIEIGFIALIIAVLTIFKRSLVINPIASAIIRNVLISNENEEEEDEDDDEL